MKTTSPEEDGEGHDSHAGENTTAQHLGVNLNIITTFNQASDEPLTHLTAGLLVPHLEVGRAEPDLAAAVADPVDHHAGEDGEAFEDLEEPRGGEESSHVIIVTQ